MRGSSLSVIDFGEPPVVEEKELCVVQSLADSSGLTQKSPRPHPLLYGGAILELMQAATRSPALL